MCVRKTRFCKVVLLEGYARFIRFSLKEKVSTKNKNITLKREMRIFLGGRAVVVNACAILLRSIMGSVTNSSLSDFSKNYRVQAKSFDIGD